MDGLIDLTAAEESTLPNQSASCGKENTTHTSTQVVGQMQKDAKESSTEEHPARWMSPQDFDACKKIIASLEDNKHCEINCCFLDRIECQYDHPSGQYKEYLSIIERPMDLRTLSDFLQDGYYSGKEDFYADAKMIFENEILLSEVAPDL